MAKPWLGAIVSRMSIVPESPGKVPEVENVPEVLPFRQILQRSAEHVSPLDGDQIHPVIPPLLEPKPDEMEAAKLAGSPQISDEQHERQQPDDLSSVFDHENEQLTSGTEVFPPGEAPLPGHEDMVRHGVA
jgi:hypothetical protein